MFCVCAGPDTPSFLRSITNTPSSTPSAPREPCALALAISYTMARKALKSLAASNASRLNRTHLTTLSLHALYHLLRLLHLHAFTRASLLRYALLVAPALAIELLIFERGSRPSYAENAPAIGAGAGAGAGAAGEGVRELRTAGADLDAPGLTDLLWDIVYWTWAVLALVAVAGEWAWWLYVSLPPFPSRAHRSRRARAPSARAMSRASVSLTRALPAGEQGLCRLRSPYTARTRRTARSAACAAGWEAWASAQARVEARGRARTARRRARRAAASGRRRWRSVGRRGAVSCSSNSSIAEGPVGVGGVRARDACVVRYAVRVWARGRRRFAPAPALARAVWRLRLLHVRLQASSIPVGVRTPLCQPLRSVARYTHGRDQTCPTPHSIQIAAVATRLSALPHTQRVNPGAASPYSVPCFLGRPFLHSPGPAARSHQRNLARGLAAARACARRRERCSEAKDLIGELADGACLVVAEGLAGLLHRRDHGRRTADEDLDVGGGGGELVLLGQTRERRAGQRSARRRMVVAGAVTKRRTFIISCVTKPTPPSHLSGGLLST